MTKGEELADESNAHVRTDTSVLYVVPENKTVPHLYPEATDFQDMPKVFATGFMVGLMEWACIQLMQPHLDPGEGSLGFTLMSATPRPPRPV